MRPKSTLRRAASCGSFLHCRTSPSVMYTAVVSRWNISGCGEPMVKNRGTMPSLGLQVRSRWPTSSTLMAMVSEADGGGLVETAGAAGGGGAPNGDVGTTGAPSVGL